MLWNLHDALVKAQVRERVKNKILYRDKDHLFTYGSKLFTYFLINYLKY